MCHYVYKIIIVERRVIFYRNILIDKTDISFVNNVES